MNTLQHQAQKLHISSLIHFIQEKQFSLKLVKSGKIDVFYPLRRWLDKIEINSSVAAHRICQLIPSQCPFEREIKLFQRTLVKIPPMCKLNPVYNELISLRFRAICYLADVCGEDVSVYC